jgi:DNA repair exonuclease SbcCD nuclease subunit
LKASATAPGDVSITGSTPVMRRLRRARCVGWTLVEAVEGFQCPEVDSRDRCGSCLVERNVTWRFLHSADIHLDAPLRSLAATDADLRERVATASRDALRRIVDACLAHRVDGLLLAGDVFDRAEQSLNAVAFFAAEMARLAEAGIPVFMIFGNHDHENRATRKLAFPPNVHVFGAESAPVTLEGRGAPATIHGVSYEAISAPASILGRYPPATPGAVHIGLLHTSLAGASAHDAYAPCAPADLAARGYAYWALGHIHARAVYREGGATMVMPGSPQGRHINEPGPRSATLVTIEDGRVSALEEIPTAGAIFDRVTVAVGAEDVERFDRLCRRALDAHAQAVLEPGQALIARLEIRGARDAVDALRRHADLWTERVAAAADDLDAVWIERLRFAVSGPVRAEAGPVAEIAALMRSLSADPAARHALEGILRETLDFLPPAERRALALDEAAERALLDALSEEGIGEIVAALSAGEEEA